MLVKDYLGVDNLIVYQDDELYRFTSDAVLLSKFATVKKNDIVADFCSGSGIVGLNLFALNKNAIKTVDAFEMQKPLFDLNKKTIEENNLENIFSLHNIKVQNIPNDFAGKFSLIVCNPPYMEVEKGQGEEKKEIAICRREIELTLSELCSSAKKVLRFGGRFALCHRSDRLVDIITQLKNNNIEPKRLQFVCSGKSKEPYLVLIEGVMGGKSGLKVLETIFN